LEEPILKFVVLRAADSWSKELLLL